MSGVDGATSVGSLIWVRPIRCRRNVERFPRKGMSVRVTRGIALFAHSNDRLKLDVMSTIMHTHPVDILTGCSSGMKSDATRILWSQGGFHGQGTRLWHILVQIRLKRPDRAEVTSRRRSTGIELTLPIALIDVMRMSYVREKTASLENLAKRCMLETTPFNIPDTSFAS